MSELNEAARLKDAAYLEAERFELPTDWEVGREFVDGITIDSVYTRDRDDAIRLTNFPDGRKIISVSIADVGSFMGNSPAMESYAREMGETRYLRTGNITMIPPRVSEGVLSILDDKMHGDEVLRTPVLTVNLGITADGQIGGFHLTRDSMLPRAIPYFEVAKRTAGRTGSMRDNAEMLRYKKTADWLLAQRRAHGAFAVYDIEKGIMVDDDGNIINFPKGSNRAGELIVQEFMILANSAVAEYTARENVPALYRNHKLKDGARQADLQRLLSGDEVTVDLFKKVYARARYSPHLEGHVGLSLPAYMHFTSPLRRFADFVNHANLVAHMEGRPYPYQGETLEIIAAHLNEVQDETRHSNMRVVAVETKAAQRIAQKAAALGEVAAGVATNSPRLSTLLTAAVSAGEMPAELAATLRERLAEDRAITTGQLVYLVAASYGNTEEIRDIRETAMDRLAKKPEEAVSVLDAAQKAGTIRDVKQTTINEIGSWFKSTITVTDAAGNEHTVSVSAIGKKAAGQEAALKVLAVMNGYKLPETTSPTVGISQDNPKNKLQEALVAGKQPLPHYETLGSAGRFKCTVTVTIHREQHTFTAIGASKKEAEMNASLQALEGADIPPPVPRKVTAPPPPKKKAAAKAAPAEKPGMGPTNQLQEHVFATLGLRPDQVDISTLIAYDVSLPTGESHAPIFNATVTVTLGGVEQTFSGQAGNKLGARAAAAKAALEALKQTTEE